MSSLRAVAHADGAQRSWESSVVARLAAGDDAALAELYDQYSAFVYGLAARVTCDHSAAQDITQDVFVWLWEHAGAYEEGRGSLRSWLGVITHRRAVDRVRRESAHRHREANDALRSTQAPPDVAEAVTSVVVGQRLREAVDSLAPDQREAIRLAYFGGRTFRDVARILGIPEGTAKSRLRIALRKLADALRAEGIMQWN